MKLTDTSVLVQIQIFIKPHLRYVSRASENKSERSQRFGHHTKSYLIARVADYLTRHARVAVVVSWPDVLEIKDIALKF